MNLNIKPTIEAANRTLSNIERNQIPFATARALTETAKTVQKLEQRRIPRVIDRPTRYTQNSLFIQPAKKRDLKSFVGFKNVSRRGIPQAVYLEKLITGGARGKKPAERRAQSDGLLIGNQYLVPSRELRRNKFGNVTKGRVTKILDGADEKGSPYFVATIKGTRAVWQRHGRKKRKVKPLYIITSNLPDYSQQYDFGQLAGDNARRIFPRRFSSSLQRALATARQ